MSVRWDVNQRGVHQATCTACRGMAGKVIPRLDGRGWTALDERGDRAAQTGPGELVAARRAAAGKHDCQEGKGRGR